MLDKCCYILLNVPKVKNKNAMKRTTKLNKCHKNTKKNAKAYSTVRVSLFILFLYVKMFVSVMHV